MPEQYSLLFELASPFGKSQSFCCASHSPRSQNLFAEMSGRDKIIPSVRSRVAAEKVPGIFSRVIGSRRGGLSALAEAEILGDLGTMCEGHAQVMAVKVRRGAGIETV